MVDENLTDEQQADRIREWLKENGTGLLGGLGLGLAALFGWGQWQSYEVQIADEASGIYEELVGKIRASDQAAANELLMELATDYSKSPYVDQARLRLAKLSLDQSNFDVAASYLEAIVSGSSGAEILNIARVRLARIRMHQEQYDAALAVLEGATTGSSFYAQVNDVRGDIYVVLNRPDEALSAYDAALTDIRQPPAIDRAYVQAKRDRLGTDDPATATMDTDAVSTGGADDASVVAE